MPRSGIGRADAGIIAAAAARGVQVSQYQLERWRAAGELLRNEQQWLGRGRGSTSQPPTGVVDRVVALAMAARQGRRNPALGDPFVRFLAGNQSDEELRAEVLKGLVGLGGRLRADAGDGDEGADARYDAAHAIARHAQVFDAQEWINIFLTPAEVQTVRQTPSHRATTAMLQAISGGGAEIGTDDMTDVVTSFCELTVEQQEEVRRQLLADELTGRMWWNDLPDLADLQEIVRTAPAERLRRAVVVSTTVPALQWTIMFAAPFDPNPLRRLQQNSVFQNWARWLPPPRPGRRVHIDVTATMVAQMLAWPDSLLNSVEQYGMLLQQLLHGINWPSPPRPSDSGSA